ncbi:DUF4124 domain-containing protein [Cupriavidus sp. 8B]
MATNAAGQTIYQCRSAAGHVTLQDAPCQHDAKTEVMRKSIGQRNAEYRAEPSSFFDPEGQERLASSIMCVPAPVLPGCGYPLRASIAHPKFGTDPASIRGRTASRSANFQVSLRVTIHRSVRTIRHSHRTIALAPRWATTATDAGIWRLSAP